jgi:hypothetical protein
LSRSQSFDFSIYSYVQRQRCSRLQRFSRQKKMFFVLKTR